MKVVDRLVITQDKSIIVLKADNKYYLLAVSPTDIKLITELDEYNENNTAPEISGNIYQNIDFKSILFQYFPNKRK